MSDTTLPQDTPIVRASIADMSMDQILALVEHMQERRMRAYTAFEAAQAAKAKIKEAKDRERYDHLLKMFDKKIKTVDAGLEALSRYVNEFKVLELVLGE